MPLMNQGTAKLFAAEPTIKLKEVQFEDVPIITKPRAFGGQTSGRMVDFDFVINRPISDIERVQLGCSCTVAEVTNKGDHTILTGS